MPLTKQDLKAIKNIVSEEIGKEIASVKNTVSEEVETLAIITSKTFDVMEQRFDAIDKRFDANDKRFDSIDKRFENIDKRFDANDASHRTINARLDLIETDLSNLRNLVYEVKEIRRLLENAPTKTEVSRIDKRLLRVEKHLGLTKA